MSAIRRSVFALLAGLMPAAAIAQPSASSSWTPEISFAAGLGHVFRFEDQTYGNELNLGGSGTLVHRSGWAFELSADRTIGLEPHPTPCGLVNVSCVGSGRYGPHSMTVASITAHYRFKGERVKPYLLGGIGLMWTRSVNSITRVQGPIATITESASSDSGVGPDLGAGVRIAVNRHLTVSPEVRWLEAPWTSRENLAVTRLLLRISYVR
jgi:opacity protein-like surface antigen